jgi:transmembrane sensor
VQTEQELKILLTNLVKGTITDTDRETLYATLADDQKAEEWKQVITELSEEIKTTEPYDREAWEPVIRAILSKAEEEKTEEREDVVSRSATVPRMTRTRWWAAAALFAGITLATFLLIDRKSNIPAVATEDSRLPADIPAPDKNRAQIKLSDGTIIYLDSAVNGELATVNGVKLVKTADGQVAYSGSLATDDSRLPAGASPLTNTLTNPRGSKVIDMTLADGSRVWLNAGSSVTYPVAFTGNERKVQITGEAYFEVAPNKKMPFYVTNGDVQVKVLGTHFNVNAYEDEDAVRVTLLEGSVRVSRTDLPPASAGGIVIKPGEQAVATLSLSKGPLTIHHSPDLEQVLAWKNGRFVFNGTDVQTTMRQIARWYDVEIVYEGNVKGFFKGSINRKENVSEILKLLGMTDEVHFKLEGRKIIVTP